MDIASKLNIGANIAGAATGIFGAISNIGAAKRQHKRTKELMDISQRNQMALNNQQYDNSKKFWDETNYDDQVREMEKTGLNVGMMYGGGGQGGQTTGMSGGSAASAQGAADIPMDGRMGMDIASQIANIEVMKASADKMKAEAENLRGADRDKTVAGTELTKMQTENQKIINNVQGQTIEQQIDGIKANADKAQSEARSALVGANVDEKTQSSKEEEIRNSAIASALEAAVKQTGIDVGQAQIKNWAEQIKIGKFNANREAEMVGMDKVKGSMLNKAINYISEKLGIKTETETQKQIK